MEITSLVVAAAVAFTVSGLLSIVGRFRSYPTPGKAVQNKGDWKPQFRASAPLPQDISLSLANLAVALGQAPSKTLPAAEPATAQQFTPVNAR